MRRLGLMLTACLCLLVSQYVQAHSRVCVFTPAAPGSETLRGWLACTTDQGRTWVTYVIPRKWTA